MRPESPTTATVLSRDRTYIGAGFVTSTQANICLAAPSPPTHETSKARGRWGRERMGGWSLVDTVHGDLHSLAGKGYAMSTARNEQGTGEGG